MSAFDDVRWTWHTLLKEVERYMDEEEFKQFVNFLLRNGPKPWLHYFTLEIIREPDGKVVVKEIGEKGKMDIMEFLNELDYALDIINDDKTIVVSREPRIEVVKEDEGIRVVAEMPDLGNDVKVELKDGVLVVYAGDKERYLPLPGQITPAQLDPATIKTFYQNGILTVELKRRK